MPCFRKTSINGASGVLQKRAKLFRWIGGKKDLRDLSKVRFLVLKDASGLIQVTGVRGKTDDKVFELMDNISKD